MVNAVMTQVAGAELSAYGTLYQSVPLAEPWMFSVTVGVAPMVEVILSRAGPRPRPVAVRVAMAYSLLILGCATTWYPTHHWRGSRFWAAHTTQVYWL